MHADPGIVKDIQDEEHEDLTEGDTVIVCDRCKARRTNSFVNHCKTCGHCVMMFHHHCLWVSNCIGANNLKAFVLFNFYLFWLCSFHVYLLVTFFHKYNVEAGYGVQDAWTCFYFYQNLTFLTDWWRIFD